MGIVFRQSIKSTLVTFSGAALGAIITFAGTKIFTKQELGFIRTLINISAIVQALVLLGGGIVLSVFMQRYDAHDTRRKVLLTVTSLIPLVVTALLTIPYSLFKSEIVSVYKPEDQIYIATYYYYVPLLVLPWSYLTLYDLFLISEHKTAASAFVKEVILRLINMLLYCLFFYGVIAFHAIISGTIIMYSIAALLIFRIARKTKGFGFSLQWNAFTVAEYKELAHFSWYHLLLNVTFYLMGFIDTLMLGPLDKTGMASVAVYTIATFIISIMIIPFRAMTLAAFPALNKAYIDDDKIHLQDLFTRSGLNILIVGIAMFLIIGCNLNNAVAILPKGYEATASLVFILMIGRLVDMSTGLNSELIGISKYYKFNFRVSILLLALLCFTNWLLIPRYGVFGAAWGATISLCVFNLIKFLFLEKKMRITTFNAKSFQILFCGAVVFVLVYWIPGLSNPIADTVVRTLLVVILYALMLLWLKPSPDLTSFLKTLKEKKRLF